MSVSVSVSVEGMELCVCLLLYFLHNIILMYPHVATYMHFPPYISGSTVLGRMQCVCMM